MGSDGTRTKINSAGEAQDQFTRPIDYKKGVAKQKNIGLGSCVALKQRGSLAIYQRDYNRGRQDTRQERDQDCDGEDLHQFTRTKYYKNIVWIGCLSVVPSVTYTDCGLKGIELLSCLACNTMVTSLF